MNIDIIPSVIFCKTETGCKAGDKCVCSRIIRMMNNQTKSQRKTRKRESDDKNAVAIVKIVAHLGCVSQDSDALVSQRGKQSRGNPTEKVLGQVRFAQSSLGRVHRLKKHKSKKPHQRSPYAMKFEDRSHEETERQHRCARTKASKQASVSYDVFPPLPPFTFQEVTNKSSIISFSGICALDLPRSQ